MCGNTDSWTCQSMRLLSLLKYGNCFTACRNTELAVLGEGQDNWSREAERPTLTASSYHRTKASNCEGQFSHCANNIANGSCATACHLYRIILVLFFCYLFIYSFFLFYFLLSQGQKLNACTRVLKSMNKLYIEPFSWNNLVTVSYHAGKWNTFV